MSKRSLKDLQADYDERHWKIESHILFRHAVYALQDIRDELERLNSNLEKSQNRTEANIKKGEKC